MVEKNNLNVQVLGQPIFREPNGLAMSSRNQRLTENQKIEAAFIYKTLTQAKKHFMNQNVTEVVKWVQNQFKNNKNFKLEYFEIADETTLEPSSQKETNKKYRAFIAVYMNDVRLIDTISLN